jgi:hypothetical protein
MAIRSTAARGAALIFGVGGRDASVASVTRSKDGVRVECLAFAGGSAIEGPRAALAAALDGRRFSASEAYFVLGEVATHARLMTTPDAKGRALEDFIVAEIAPDDVFVDDLVGVVSEDGRELPARLVVSTARDEAAALVSAAEATGVALPPPFALDSTLLEFARRRAGETQGKTRLVAIVEPGFTHFVCVANGKSIFTRRVETDAEAPPAGRFDALIAEAQKTALVARGRLRPPPVSGCTVFDPCGVLDPSEGAAAAEASGFEVLFGDFPATIEGAATPAARGHAVRAAIAAIVLSDAKAAEKLGLDVPTRGREKRARRLKAVAAAACVAVWAGGFWGRHRMFEEAETLLAARTKHESAEDDGSIAEATASLAAANAAIDTFDEAHAAFFRFHGAPPPAFDALAALAAAAPSDAALSHVATSLVLDKGGALVRETRVQGFVRRPFVESREVVRSFTAALRVRPETLSVVEDAAPIAGALENRVDDATPFAFTVRSEAMP